MLQAVRFDPARLEVTGPPVAVAHDVLSKPSGGASFDLAADGTLVYISSGRSGGVGRRLVLVDRHGGRQTRNAPRRAYTLVSVSPDGRRAAVDIRDQQGDVWIWDFEREALTRLTIAPSPGQVPIWTPDGRRIWVPLAAATLLPIAALGWLGVRILQQDRDIERQRQRERLEVAAGRLALDIERHLQQTDEQLASGRGVAFLQAQLAFQRVVETPGDMVVDEAP
jgi:dipeptidyl aminopeptidase/acylaminoacyl peptidase